MAVLSRRRRAFALAGVAALALAAAACGDSGSDTGSTSADKPECAPYAQYKVDKKKTVSIYATIRDAEADKLTSSWKQFEECTNIKIEYEGSGEFETQIKVRADGGQPPDIAVFPQPGLLASFATKGQLKELPAPVKANLDKNWSKDWAKYATVNGKVYGVPLGANVKSLVWYSPQLFKEKGYKVPTTWDEMIKLSDDIAATGIKAWCAGIESGDATGWPATDWIEDIVLRDQGPDVYDQWVNHTIPFNDPRIVSAAERTASILKNPKYVGNPKTIVTTSFQEGGLPVKDKKCGLHRQANFYSNQWAKGTNVAEDGDVFAFYFPAVDPAKGKPVLVAGEFVSAFSDREEVVKVQTYLASAEWANSKAKLGDWISANKNLDVSLVTGSIDKLSVKILQDPATVARFDGSDLMPAAVGSKSFWTGMTDWINGTKDTKATLDYIESTWPK
ncbi:ABC transporter substrate-binding protein [Dactylosporangium siamense]|uniref:Alpha-glucoside ABC transporter substrate-binding protein n=1 Tax=Dactylosporangium siamense TaxID=685454 RepID=A0A919UHK1_9ACTN|nr:ABC transporter substrate-binding protein [Dactylosporangium siamense]GIG51685.1 alpha-glucoside ABC transporter substrate-binding protein [Dactylosporangium siamense]